VNAAPEGNGVVPRANAAAPPPTQAIRRLQRQVLGWYAANRRDLPWRRTTDPYAILVSEVMLQQTQVSRVVPKYGEWLASLPTLEALAAAPLEEVLRLWRGLGYNNRARRLRECALAVCAATDDGRASRGPGASLPRDAAALRALPGIGPYTARAVLIFAHNDDLAAVDANVRRVLTHELGLPRDLPDRRLQAIADAALPRGRSRDWHNALMDYGALVLTARATGIAPRTRQSAFEGSRRWYRSRLLRTLLDDGAQAVPALAARLEVPETDATELVALLERDGLVRWDGALVCVA
jgi:A/G-specific adenine glycosylase